MKLFVWDGVLTDYTSGIIIAYAETIEDARRLILEVDDLAPIRSAIEDEPKVYDGQPAARVVWGGD